MPENILQQQVDDAALNQFTLADEQMRSLYHSLPVSLLSSLMIALILSVSHWKVIGQAEIILWNLLLGGTLLARLSLWIFWHNVHQLYSTRFWLNCFRIGVWVSGCAWGSSAMLLFAHDDTTYQALLAFSLAGVASGSMTSLNVDKYSSIGFVVLTISPLSVSIFLEDGPTAIAMSSMTLLFIFFVIASSARARHNMEDQVNKNFRLLHLTSALNLQQKMEKIINHAQSIYIAEGDINSALQKLLRETLTLCESEMGFIGQVKKDDDNSPYMQALVFEAGKRDDHEFESFRAANLPENGEYRNMDNLFGMIMQSEKPIISLNLARDMRAGSLPTGHPAIDNFMGIPIFVGQQQVAILGLANSSAGYTNQTAEDLQPILKSVGQFVQTMNHEQQHARDKAALEASTQHTQTILNDIADGVISISKDGTIQSFNHAAETIFGYRSNQIVGKNISELMAEPHKSYHTTYLKNHLNTGKKTILGVGREVCGLRRNGDEFPMDLMVSRIFQHGEPMFIGIIRDITEKKRVDDLRSQFITAASNEIMGPLNLITEAINLLQSGDNGAVPTPLRHALEIAQNNSIKLHKLMNDLMEVQNLSKGDAAFTMQTQTVLPLMEETLRRNKAFSDIYQCKLAIQTSVANLTIITDKNRFYQAFSQLLQYALKLSDPKTEIPVRINEDRSLVKITIALPGKNLTKYLRENLALHFGQKNEADKLDQDKHAEGDLGLAIAKEIIEKMHGKIYLLQKADEYSFVVEFQQAVKQVI